MPAWGWILLIAGAFCFGWVLGADWLEDGGPFFGRWRGKPQSYYRKRLEDLVGAPLDDYYVDPEHGNDETGDGSKEKPFKTAARLKKEFQ